MFTEIKSQFIDGLEEQKWMDNKTRAQARLKVSKHQSYAWRWRKKLTKKLTSDLPDIFKHQAENNINVMVEITVKTRPIDFLAPVYDN